MDGWLEAAWLAPPGVRAGTATRRFPGVSLPPFGDSNFGSRCGDDPAAVARNRALLRSGLQLPAEPRWLRQVHGTQVVVFDGAPDDPADRRDAAEPAAAPPAGTPEPEADAAVTRSPCVVLAILTADCLPVVFASDDGEVIAAAHAGWRGLAAGVLEATLDAMDVDPARCRAWFGPAAGPAAYEVGEDVRSAFVDRDPGAAMAFVDTRPGHWHCDLHALARRRLAARGLTDIAGGTHCTITDAANFHSHRRDGRGGRIATLAWRDPPGAARASA
jgi:YfiH family protein